MDFYSEIKKAGRIAARDFHGDFLGSVEKINDLFALSESAASQAWDGESRLSGADVISGFEFKMINVKFSVRALFCRVDGVYADKPSLVKINMQKAE